MKSKQSTAGERARVGGCELAEAKEVFGERKTLAVS